MQNLIELEYSNILEYKHWRNTKTTSWAHAKIKKAMENI